MQISQIIPLKLAEKTFAIAALLFYTRAFADFIPAGHPVASLKEVLAYFAFFTTLLLLARYWKKLIHIALKEWLLWTLIILIVLSTQWSDLPQETSKLVIPLLRVTVFGIYFAIRFSIREQMQLLAWVFGVAALFSLAFAVALPQYGIVGLGFISNSQDTTHLGTWRGIYVHKTMLGTMMALGMLTFLYWAASARKYRWIAILGFCLCFELLLKSTTKGALAIFFLLVVLFPLYKALRLKSSLAIPFFGSVILISGITFVLVIFNAERILGALGRDITLTGRTIYWPLMLVKIWERPWFGYGYQTFWLGGWKGEVADVWQFLAYGNEPPHAHNGYLNLWFDVGLVGLSIFVIGFLITYFRSLAWMRINRTIDGFVPLCYLTLLFLVNLTESFLVEPNFFWLFYVAITLSMRQKKSLASMQTNQD